MSIRPSSSLNRNLTTGETAKYCGVNFRTVIRWIEKGLLDAYKLPGRGDHRIPVLSLLDFMQKNQMPVPEEINLLNQQILVVDDDPPMAKSIARVLNKVGYQTHIANNGFIAGAMMQKLKPVLVTLDLKMPKLDGLEVLKYARSDKILSRTKILVISAQPEHELKKALSAGADDILAKPFANKELLSIVDKLLAIKLIRGD